MTLRKHFSIALCAALAAITSTQDASAQSVTVDYPDSVVQNPSTLAFPFYTFGSVPPLTVRYQTFMPSTFVDMPTEPMIATKVGIQIAGQNLYNQFEVRLSNGPLDGLFPTFADNLLDDRLQSDQSGTVLQGGVDQAGNPVSQWVEYDLAHPFVHSPGESIVLEIISSAAVDFCETAIGGQGRMWAVGGDAVTGTVTPDNGIKFRVVFEPIRTTLYGAGCPGTGGVIPTHSVVGSGQTGTSLSLNLSQALDPSFGVVSLGFSRDTFGGSPLPLVYSGSCSLLTSFDLTFDVFWGGTTPGAGLGEAAFPIAIPMDASLDGLELYSQYLVFDMAEPVFNFVTSNAVQTLIYD